MSFEQEGERTPQQDDPNASAASRVSFERLRERTDELELLISGLSLFALISLPSWLFDVSSEYSARMPIALLALVSALSPLITAIAWTMAALFVLHLLVRAHWVGLIGLKAIFPDGIRWQRLTGIGPVTRSSLTKGLPDIGQVIQRADRTASILFSLITSSAIALAMMGLWISGLFLIAGVFGDELGGTNAFINVSVGWLLLAFVVAPPALWLLDGVLARRWPKLASFALFRLLIHTLGWVERLFFPRRLVATSRLYVQSNTWPRAFFAVFFSAILAVLFFGNQAFQSGRGFDVFGTFAYLNNRDLLSGQRSQRYESQLLPHERRTMGALIPAPLIETAWLPVFLPHHPLLDVPVLKHRCPEGPTAPIDFSQSNPGNRSEADAEAQDAESDAISERAAVCLRRLWALKLDGKPIDMAGFVVSERRDIGMRGLSGYVPLAGLQPGAHRLEAIWRPNPELETVVTDYVPNRIRYVVPFAWSPEAAALPAAEN